MSSEDEGRLTRWSKRKAAARKRRGSAAPALPEEPAILPATKATPADGLPPEAHAGDSPEGPPHLPDIESLSAESDFTAFMKEGVPAQLRRLALRKLWASDPMFNVIDEMVEYGEDYTDAAMVVAGLKSGWEAGRGYADKTTQDRSDDSQAERSPDDVGASEDSRESEVPAEAETASDEDGLDDRNEEKG